MDKILSIQTIKNVFAALGAKTSDDNYGVALLDKTTAEPKGLMDMPNLATVLDVPKYQSVTAPRAEIAHLFDKPSVGLMFLLRYDSRSRFGVYVYNRESNSIETILAAPIVEVVTTPSGITKYELYVDNTNNCISITNIASREMTFEYKIL